VSTTSNTEPLYFTIECDEGPHDLVLTAEGDVLPLDHDLEEELAAAAMGAERLPECLVLMEQLKTNPTWWLWVAARRGNAGLAAAALRLGADFRAESYAAHKEAKRRGHTAVADLILAAIRWDHGYRW
jgi:hypothetical protein